MSQPWSYCEHCGTIDPPTQLVVAKLEGQIGDGVGDDVRLELYDVSQTRTYVCSDCGKEVDYDGDV